jgi:hypothetical protein
MASTHAEEAWFEIQLEPSIHDAAAAIPGRNLRGSAQLPAAYPDNVEYVAAAIDQIDGDFHVQHEEFGGQACKAADSAIKE